MGYVQYEQGSGDHRWNANVLNNITYTLLVCNKTHAVSRKYHTEILCITHYSKCSITLVRKIVCLFCPYIKKKNGDRLSSRNAVDHHGSIVYLCTAPDN